MVVRGVPHKIARDGWWLDDTEPLKGVRAAPLLLVSLTLADALIWDQRPGAGMAVWVLLSGILAALTVYRALDGRRLAIAAFVILGTALPLFDVVQFGSVVIALMGLVAGSVIVCESRGDASSLLRAVARFPGYGLMQNLRDALAVRVTMPSKGGLSRIIEDWALPAVIGGIFAALIVAANPIVDAWVLAIVGLEPDFLPGWPRAIFWLLLGSFAWPLLRLTDLGPRLTRPRVKVKATLQSGLINARSVSRALILFNLLFAMQTSLDLGYLWTGTALPDGMTYAEYAHRGAYPLLATAILAGLFALIAQPYLGEGKTLRVLLYLWIGQTVLLVISSILRLDLYVDVYGLTRLRFAAFIWMIVVALGLTLIVMQMVGRQSVGWSIRRALGIGFVAIYLCNLVNIDGLIARNNLASDAHDSFYLCGLSEGAIVAIRAHELRTGEEICYSRRPDLSRRDDWREWGYRNARLHRSLAALEEQQ